MTIFCTRWLAAKAPAGNACPIVAGTTAKPLWKSSVRADEHGEIVCGDPDGTAEPMNLYQLLDYLPA